LNDGAGRFSLAAASDPFCLDVGVARGLATGDVDGDGDLDLLVTFADAPPRLFLNDAPKRGAWVKIRAVDPAAGGRDAYGAEISAYCGARTHRGAISPGASYLSAHDPAVYFGLGDAAAIDRFEVRWPDGTREQFPAGAANRDYVLRRGAGQTP
jgi:hypothetical protein